MSSRTCVKVANLRKLYGSDSNLKNWSESPDNVYCGRSGRIFVNKEYFGYAGSKWANPFSLKKYSIEDSLSEYLKYITEKIKNDPKYDLNELKGKNLGCWCDSKNRCHVDVLLELVKNC